MTIADPCVIPDLSWTFDEEDIPYESWSCTFDSTCAIWQWCAPTDSPPLPACHRESSECVEEDVCDACDNSGAWKQIGGDADDIAEPIFAGRFIGEVVILSHCPSCYMEHSSVFAYTESLSVQGSYGCDDLPDNPFPFQIPYRQVTQASWLAKRIAREGGCDPMTFCETRGIWIWCTEHGEEKWIHGGGCIELGPPPIDGRQAGETVIIGTCCGPFESSLSVEPSHSIADGCDELPGWFQTHWARELEYYDDRPIQLAPSYTIPTIACGSWIWCTCNDDEDCKQRFPAVENHEGTWKRCDAGPSVDYGPCVKGRFLGEVIFFCSCSSSSIACPPGSFMFLRLNPEALIDPTATGVYDLVGEYDGANLYWNGLWYLYFHDHGDGTWSWDIQQSMPPTVDATGYWLEGTGATGPTPELGYYEQYPDGGYGSLLSAC